MPKHISSRRIRRSVLVALAVLAGVVVPELSAAGAGTGTGEGVRQDFNGDGYQDLAVSAPNATVDGKLLAGYVAVVYGSANGLDLHKKKVYSQASAGVPGSPEEVDTFGDRLDAADLDGDGYTDLLVVAAGEKLRQDGVNRSGSLTVPWGGSAGLGAGTVLPAFGGGGVHVGLTATGDFNGDGRQDLLRRDHVEFGPFGRDSRPASVQSAPRLSEDDQWVDHVTAGDVDGDGATDLVTCSMSGPDGDENYDEYINYVPGGHDGLRPSTDVDVDGDGYADISVGVPFEDVGKVENAGRVVVLRGTANGPTGSDAQSFTQNTAGVPGAAEANDNLGRATHLVDANHDGRAELVVGAPAENGGSVVVGVFRSTASGVTASGSFAFGNGTLGTPVTGSLLGYNFSD